MSQQSRQSFFANKYFFTKLILASALYDSLFIVSYINVFINNIAQTPFWISTVLAIRRLTRILLDMPIGALVDKKIGVKNGLMLSIVFKMLFLILIAQHTLTTLLIATFFEGISISFFRGKINVAQYNILKSMEKEDLFKKINAGYNLSTYALTFVFGLLAHYFYSTNHQAAIIEGSFFLLAIEFFLIKSTFSKQHYTQSSISPKATLKHNILHHQTMWHIVGLSILLGICQLSWQLGTMNQFFILRLGRDAKFSAIIFNVSTMIMMFGSILSWKIAETRSDFKMFCFFIVTLGFNCLSFFLREGIDAFLLIMPYFLFFTSYENYLKNKIIAHSPVNHQSLCISISTTITSILSLLITYFFHYLGSFIDYYLSYAATFVILICIAIVGFVFYRLTKLTNNATI